jgi:hypothetical protein
LELLHLVAEALAFVADSITLRYAHVVKKDLGGVRRVHADLADLALDGDPTGAHGNDDQRLVRASCRRMSSRDHINRPRHRSLSKFAAVDHVVVAIRARS